jgi:hypothetical protein
MLFRRKAAAVRHLHVFACLFLLFSAFSCLFLPFHAFSCLFCVFVFCFGWSHGSRQLEYLSENGLVVGCENVFLTRSIGSPPILPKVTCSSPDFVKQQKAEKAEKAEKGKKKHEKARECRKGLQHVHAE